MIAFVWLGPLSAFIAFAPAWIWGRDPTRYGLILSLGVVLALGRFAAGLFLAPSDPNHVPNCSDCSYTWGRWWEPQLAVAALMLNLVASVVGATLGAMLRRVLLGRRAARQGSPNS
jgi:hypothetical protein